MIAKKYKGTCFNIRYLLLKNLLVLIPIIYYLFSIPKICFIKFIYENHIISRYIYIFKCIIKSINAFKNLIIISNNSEQGKLLVYIYKAAILLVL